MKTLGNVAAVALLLVAAAAPCLASGVAVIETTAPLTEQSKEGITMAVATAVQTAAKGAVAMGLPHFTLKGVRVLPQIVIVQIWATDLDADETDAAPPEDTPSDEPAGPELGPHQQQVRGIDTQEERL